MDAVRKDYRIALDRPGQPRAGLGGDLFALAGTVLMAVVGVKLPGLEFENQRVEAAFRKSSSTVRTTRTATARFNGCSPSAADYFRLFFHYMYFDVARYAYLQFGVLVPYIALGPTRWRASSLSCHAADRSRFRQGGKLVPISVSSWTTIVELISVYKRLRAFEHRIGGAAANARRQDRQRTDKRFG